MGEKTYKPTTVEEYVAGFPEDIQAIVAKIREVIRETAPEAVEKISYNMPAYYLDGGLLSFSVWKHHIGFYPWQPEMEAAVPGLSAYKGSKGSVHFPLDKPIPYDLIREMVKFRMKENQDRKQPTSLAINSSKSGAN
jgi:uncharacterized protein YdhG (YjbR/CyaY superfamily)